MTTKTKDLIARLRAATQKLRRTSMPIADVAPMLVEAADTIEQLQLERVAELKCRIQNKDDAISEWRSQLAPLRAELAAIRATKEPVGVVDKRIPGNVRWGEWSSLQDGDKLYSAPAASPDVGVLADLLQDGDKLYSAPAASPDVGVLADLLQEVSRNFTREDDLPDGLLQRIDAALTQPPAKSVKMVTPYISQEHFDRAFPDTPQPPAQPVNAVMPNLTKEMIDAAENLDWSDADVRGNIVNMWNVITILASSRPAS